MRIESLRIENFRSFKDETINFSDYTCLVGPNGAGKSTVLAALNIFFRQTENTATDVVNLSAEDFHQKDTKHPVKISLTFANLSAEAIEDFKDYYRHGKLIVSAVAEFDDRVGSAEVKQYGQRLGMEDFRNFFEALSEGKVVADLKKIYQQIKDKYPDLPEPGTKDAMTKALRTYEDANPKLATAIPSEDQFYGVSRGANRLSRYIQWVYIPAVKDAAEEQSEGKSTALGKLLSRTVRQKLKFDDIIRDLQARTAAEYQTVLDSHQDALRELGKTLEEKLSLWAHPGASLKLIWQQDSRKSVQIEQPAARSLVGEGAFEGDLSRFGHGFGCLCR